MRLEKITIQKYRSIDEISISFPENKPVVLFGPNNAGKSNILSAIDRLLGERFPPYIEMLESDYYMRDKDKYPTVSISADFSDVYHVYRAKRYKAITVTYGYGGKLNENLIHDGAGNKLYISNEDRVKCQSYFIDAERNIQSAFNYGSRYSLLSKFSHKIHTALSNSKKEDLTEAFCKIKQSFEEIPDFQNFFEKFSAVLQGAVKGFVHSLAVDFSAYDPNNYAKSMRIYARDGVNVRSFEEFGTGEQQVLLMAFVKAYMEIFTNEKFVLIIEEPEAHLHPLAQKWLKEYISEMCSNGIQVIVSTHSADFIDAEYLEGLVRVYKENGITKTVQLSKEDLCSFCIRSGVPAEIASSATIDDFYSTKIFEDQLRGMFAETVILVEGATEQFAFPIYLKRIKFSLAEHGIEIVNCRGKNNIPLLWRLFSAYKYKCYFIFDSDAKANENEKIFNGIITASSWETAHDRYVMTDQYAYFGIDFERYFRVAIPEYSLLEQECVNKYHIVSKQGKAKGVAQHCKKIPEFIAELKEKLEKYNQ